MARGFHVDTTKSAANLYNHNPSLWIEGEPIAEQGIFGPTGGLDLGNSRRFMVRSMRCERCGFLELYAV